MGCNKVVINSDSLKVVEALRDGNSSLVTSAIIDDCYFMSSDFNHAYYDHCNRECNKVAHELSRLVKFSPPSVWMVSNSGLRRPKKDSNSGVHVKKSISPVCQLVDLMA